MSDVPEAVSPELEPWSRPWDKYIVIADAALGEHGTVSVVSGASVADVVRAFGGDPERPESLSALEAEELEAGRPPFSMAVLPTTAAGGEPGAIVLEAFGFQGMYAIKPASVHGRAASFHQNAKGLTNLAFAEGGEVLFSAEFFAPEDVPPPVAAAMEGLDFQENEDQDNTEKSLYALERFTGCAIPLDAWEQIRSADVGYRIPG